MNITYSKNVIYKSFKYSLNAYEQKIKQLLGARSFAQSLLAAVQRYCFYFSTKLQSQQSKTLSV